jgi:hypothetical protein
MTHKTLAAHTPATGYRVFPPFVNFTQDGEEVVITVRGHEKPGGGAADCGETVSMRIPEADFAALLRQAMQADDMVKRMTDRFLAWKLPANFSPDDGISFDPLSSKGTPFERKREPLGTNLLDATQAAAMVRHLLAD